MHESRQPVLTGWQLFSLVLNSIVGVGIFGLARRAGEVAGRGVLLAIPLAGVFVVLQIIGMFLLASRFPQQTLSEYARQILGDFLGRIYLLGYILMTIALVLIASRSYWLLASSWTMERTPQIAFLLPLVLVCWNVARRGIVVTARTVELINYGGMTLIFLLMLPILDLDWDLVRPVLDTGISGVLRGIPLTIYSISGSEIILLVFPFVRSKRAFAITVAALALATLFYMVTTLFILGTLGLELTVLTPWPLQLYLNRFAFALFERFDVVFLIVWAFQMVNLISINMYTAANCLRGVYPRLDAQRSALIVLMLVLVGIAIPARAAIQSIIVKQFSLAALIYYGVLPFLLLLVAILRGKKGEDRDEQKEMA